LLNCNEGRFRLFVRLSFWRFVHKLLIKNTKKKRGNCEEMQVREDNLLSLRCSQFPGTIFYGRFHYLCTISSSAYVFRKLLDTNLNHTCFEPFFVTLRTDKLVAISTFRSIIQYRCVNFSRNSFLGNKFLLYQFQNPYYYWYALLEERIKVRIFILKFSQVREI